MRHLLALIAAAALWAGALVCLTSGQQVAGAVLWVTGVAPLAFALDPVVRRLGRGGPYVGTVGDGPLGPPGPSGDGGGGGDGGGAAGA